MNIERVLTDFARAKWLATLADPSSEKTTGKLENFAKPNERCCLGHACHALAPKSRVVEGTVVYYEVQYDKVLSPRMCRTLGITNTGGFKKHLMSKEISVFKGDPDEFTSSRSNRKRDYYVSLAGVNDGTNLTPQEIGRLIADQFERDNFISTLDSE